MAELSELANLPSAPPPPPEVKVRTMRSDLESMAKTGGGMPRFENVPVTGTSVVRGSADGLAAEKKSPVMVIIIAIVAFAAVAAVGYFAYVTFFAQPSSGAPAAQVVPTSTAGGAGTAVATHQSLFKKPADQMLAITFLAQGSVQSAADLKTYSQKMLGALATADASSNFIEIDAQGSDGHDLTIEELLAEASAPILDPQFLAAHFNQDATFFVYRDQSGFWPGYVIALKPTENWLFLKGDVQKLESSPSIDNLFLINPGNPLPNGFVDATIQNVSARILPFDSTTTPAIFAYGWVNGYLVLSTSPDGFDQAVTRL